MSLNKVNYSKLSRDTGVSYSVINVWRNSRSLLIDCLIERDTLLIDNNILDAEVARLKTKLNKVSTFSNED